MWKDALIEASLSLRRGFSFFILPLFFLNQWFMTVIFPKGHVLSNLSTCHFPTLPNSTTIEISPKTSKWPLFIHTLHIVTAWLLRFRQQEHHRQWQNSHHHHHHRDTALRLAFLFVQSTRKKSPGWQTQDLLHVFPELNTHNLYVCTRKVIYSNKEHVLYIFHFIMFTVHNEKTKTDQPWFAYAFGSCLWFGIQLWAYALPKHPDTVRNEIVKRVICQRDVLV